MQVRHYAEIIEELTEDELLTKEPQMLRVEGKDETEARQLVEKYEPMFAGIKYKKQIHIHRHAATGGKPCRIIKL